MKSISDVFSLKNGVNMPGFGLGVFRSMPGREVESAVLCALEVGYRAIDTASAYRNEEGVGNAIRQSGISRDAIFVTSKVWNTQQGYDNTLKAFDQSLKALGLDVLDLYLIHWPKPQNHETWRALERLYKEGRVRAIGVSNFLESHLQDLMSVAEIAPMVNQIEFHPHLQQPQLQTYCARHEIRLTAWAPIMRGRVSDLPLLQLLARRHRKTPVQIALRWALQKGIVVIPKSSQSIRIRSNARVFDFELSAFEMSKIDAMDCDSRIGPHPDRIDF